MVSEAYLVADRGCVNVPWDSDYRTQIHTLGPIIVSLA